MGRPERRQEAAALPADLLALANPEPEIMPDLVKQVRPDAIMATTTSSLTS